MGAGRGVKPRGRQRERTAPPRDDPARPAREDLVRALVLEAYGRIRQERKVADRTLETLLRRERRLYSSERRAVAEAVYGLLRREAVLGWLLEQGLGATYASLPQGTKHGLLYEAYRVREGTPPGQALVEGGLSHSLFPGLLAVGKAEEHLATLAPTERLSVEAGLPPWLGERLAAELGPEQAAALARSLNERAPLTLRINRLKGDRAAALVALSKEDVEGRPTALSPDGIAVDGRKNLFSLTAFRSGLFEIQDEGSQLLSALLDPHPGWRVVDACAGAGGKTLALAASMKNKGRIVALDNDERRLSELAPRARRAGVHNWEAHVVPGDEPGEIELKLCGTADAVLIDAPCSGSGVLRRNPDARYRLTPEEIERYATLQRRLIHRYAALLRPGGRLVYATCSVLRAEDEEVVEAALREDPTLELLPPSTTLGPLAEKVTSGGYLRLWPHLHGTDGFFAALLRRKESSGEPATESPPA